MSIETPAPEEKPPRKLFLPSLIIAIFSVNISNSIITLLAVDIAKTFFGSANAAAVAAVSQLSTVNAAAEVIFALLLSILAIRFRHKPLLLAGVIFVVVSAVGSFLAPTLLSLQLFYAVEGIGSVMVTVLAFTLIGDSLPADKKTKAISYVRSVGPAAGLVGVLLIGFIANFGGWRSDFLFFALPASAAGLILASFVLPSRPREKPATSQENPYVRSFKQVFTNRSATACLIASHSYRSRNTGRNLRNSFLPNPIRGTQRLDRGDFRRSIHNYVRCALGCGSTCEQIRSETYSSIKHSFSGFFHDDILLYSQPLGLYGLSTCCMCGLQLSQVQRLFVLFLTRFQNPAAP